MKKVIYNSLKDRCISSTFTLDFLDLQAILSELVSYETFYTGDVFDYIDALREDANQYESLRKVIIYRSFTTITSTESYNEMLDTEDVRVVGTVVFDTMSEVMTYLNKLNYWNSGLMFVLSLEYDGNTEESCFSLVSIDYDEWD